MQRWACGMMAAALGVGAPVEAAWHRASSAHFIIYSNESPETLRAFATRLETFDKAVRHVRRMEDPEIGDGNRLTVFVVANRDAVQRLIGDRSGTVAGFYTGRATGSIAVVPRESGSDRPDSLSAENVFFHEYAHHLMFSDYRTPYPEWLIEGFAEFMSTARFERDGGVGLGVPPQFRAYGLLEGGPLKIERLLNGNFGKLTPLRRDTVYGRSWLLAHYLNFHKPRAGQLETYLADLARRAEPLAAAGKAFGDLRMLDRELDKYLAQSRVSYTKVTGPGLKPGPVSIEPLSKGAAAVMSERIRSRVGVNRTTAEPLAIRVRAIAQQYPGDPLVERTLAEAELDAGHPDAALDAADRALKTDPRDGEAMIYKGRALMAGEQPRRFSAARTWFLGANTIDTEDPEPLMLFFQSFAIEGRRPTANAIAALHYASNLAPQDLGLRLNSAAQYLRDGKPVDARATLVPVAYNPHGQGIATIARSMIEKIDAKDPSAALKLDAEGAEASPAAPGSQQ